MKHVRNFNETIDITNYSNLKKWVKDDDKIEKINIIKPKNEDIENLRTEIENKNKIFQKKIIDYILYFMNEYKIEDIGVVDTNILFENDNIIRFFLLKGKLIIDVDYRKHAIEDMYNIYDIYNYIKKIEKNKTLFLKSILYANINLTEEQLHNFLENNIDEIDLYNSDDDNIINVLMHNDLQSEPIADYFDSYEFQKLAFSEKEDQMIELYKKYYDNKTDDAIFIIDDKIKEEFDEFFGMEDIGLR